MQNTETKTNNSVKSKLVAAIAMLLVATIMVVSSTYAWFTLSTKPEVTGVSTAVGANGALEIVLANWGNGGWSQGSGSVAEVASEAEKNTYWGNLINLGYHDVYGSDKITLYPSTLTLNDQGKMSLAHPLSTPEYGVDGRVSKVSPNTSFGSFYTGFFYENKAETPTYGFRAIGVTSGLTTRQKAHRDAITALATARYDAQTLARTSLSANGTTLANIAVKKAMQGDGAKYTAAEVTAINKMIDGIEDSLLKVEEAYIQAIYAVIYSGINTQGDVAAEVAALEVANAVGEAPATLDARLDAAIAKVNELGVTNIEANLQGYTKYQEAIAALNEAKDKQIAAADDKTWAEISPSLVELVNVNDVTVNDLTLQEVNTPDGKQQIFNAATNGGLTVAIPTGGGVYADIADLCGNYSVSIEINAGEINASISGFTVPAKMVTKSTQNPAFITGIVDTVKANEPGVDNYKKRPMTEFYGYAIDLGFRTNASNSNLLLKTEAADRIYQENSNNKTMGKGSTMTFNSKDNEFDEEKIADLMENINIVFYETNSESEYVTILAKAKLDFTVDDKVIKDQEGVTAPLRIVDGTDFKSEADAVITSLEPNQPKYITALVYLDGESIQNSDVAAKIAQSMTGTLNLQFASSAELVPMEYSELHQK